MRIELGQIPWLKPECFMKYDMIEERSQSGIKTQQAQYKA